MKKFLSFVVCAFFVLASTGICFATVENIPQPKNEVAERFSLGTEIVYYGYGDKHDDSEVKGTPMFKVVGEYSVNENIAVNTKIGIAETDVKDTDEGTNVLKLDIVPIELNLKLQLPMMDNQLIPYAGGGLAYNIVSADWHNDLKNELPPFGSMTVDAEDCWGGQLFAGIDYRPISCLGIYAEAGYSFAQTDVKYEINARPYYYESGTAELSLDSGFLGVGVKYLF